MHGGAQCNLRTQPADLQIVSPQHEGRRRGGGDGVYCTAREDRDPVESRGQHLCTFVSSSTAVSNHQARLLFPGRLHFRLCTPCFVAFSPCLSLHSICTLTKPQTGLLGGRGRGGRLAQLPIPALVTLRCREPGLDFWLIFCTHSFWRSWNNESM